MPQSIHCLFILVELVIEIPAAITLHGNGQTPVIRSSGVWHSSPGLTSWAAGAIQRQIDYLQ